MSYKRTLTHTGSEVGEENVSLTANTAGTASPVATWTVPRKFEKVMVRGGSHSTRAVLRSKETASGDGSTTTFTLSADILPIAGEEKLDDQPFDAVIAAVGGAEVEIASIDYIANEVTLASAPATGADNIAFFPVITEGTANFHGLDQFDHDRGAAEDWGVPVSVFADFDSYRTDIHMPAHVDLGEYEKLALYVDSPQTVVWQDADYPRGQFASSLAQGVNVALK